MKFQTELLLKNFTLLMLFRQAIKINKWMWIKQTFLENVRTVMVAKVLDILTIKGETFKQNAHLNKASIMQCVIEKMRMTF